MNSTKVRELLNKISLLCRGYPELKYSIHTGAFYVTSPIEITDGSIIRGITVHRADPEGAVQAYWDVLCSVKLMGKEFLRIPRGEELLFAQYSKDAEMFVFVTEKEAVHALTKDNAQ